MANAQDIKYAKDMIPHHEMAVEMSAMEHISGSDTELKAFAKNIYLNQLEEITWLKAWLAKRDTAGNTAPAQPGGM